MTGAARCELSDLPVEQCGCHKHRPGLSAVDVAPPQARTTYPLTTVVTAQYSGTCPECGDRYGVGDSITPQQFKTIGTGTGRWAHEDCAREVSS